MAHVDQVLSQEHLLEHVWDEHADPFTNTVRVTVGTLRRKLSEDDEPQAIETVIGSGYRLVDLAPTPMADETLAVRAAEALPGWAGSIRFRLMVLYSVLLFGLATVVVGGIYAGLAEASRTRRLAPRRPPCCSATPTVAT